MSSGLEWSSLRSHLPAGWTSVFSWGVIKPPHQRSSPFFPEVHTSSQYYGRPPTRLASVLLLQLLSHPLTVLKKKDRSTCLLWMSLCRTAMPAHSYQMEGEGEPSVQAVQSHICTRWMRLLGGWTSGFSASLNGCAPGLQAKMLANEEAGLDSASLRDLRSATDLTLSATIDPHGPTIAPSCPTVVIADKIKHFKNSFSAYHKHPALIQPVCTAFSTPCHMGRGLSSHPSPIRTKTTALPRCARHHSAQRERSGPPCRGDESAGKRSHRNCSSSPERVRLLQPLLPRPQKRRQPATYSRSQTPELCPDEKVVQDDHFETDPPANMPRGLVHVAGS